MATEKTAGRTLNLSEFNIFVNEFKGESDRAAVILGAAKLDLLLYQILECFLGPSVSGKDELLDGDSALGTFSAKIMIAYRLGLIDAEFTRCLQFVRKIRNAFAHEVAGCTLDNGSHRDRTKEFVAPMRHKKIFEDLRKSAFGDKDEPSTNFRTALSILVVRLEYLLSHVERVDSTKALALFTKKSSQEIANPRSQKTLEKSASEPRELGKKLHAERL